MYASSSKLLVSSDEFALNIGIIWSSESETFNDISVTLSERSDNIGIDVDISFNKLVPTNFLIFPIVFQQL